jgi:hypothetical protein
MAQHVMQGARVVRTVGEHKLLTVPEGVEQLWQLFVSALVDDVPSLWH